MTTTEDIVQALKGKEQDSLDMDPLKDCTLDPAAKKNSSKRGLPLVESEVRRSPRLKEVRKGFKTSACSDKKCLACYTKPPTLKIATIRKIGTNFCKLDPTTLTDDLLQGKRKKINPIASKGATPSQTAEEDLVAI